MQSTNVIKLYEIGRRGRPIRTIGPGDLADPSARSLWKRAKTLGAAIVETWRESRELEVRLRAQSGYRGFRED